MKIVPIGENVLLKRTPAEETTQGGIILPESSRSAPAEGRIVSVGDGRLLPNGRRVELQVKEGDRVLFISYAASEVNIDGEQLLMLRESDILAVLQ